jgi:hypothetical protein
VKSAVFTRVESQFTRGWSSLQTSSGDHPLHTAQRVAAANHGTQPLVSPNFVLFFAFFRIFLCFEKLKQDTLKNFLFSYLNELSDMASIDATFSDVVLIDNTFQFSLSFENAIQNTKLKALFENIYINTSMQQVNAATQQKYFQLNTSIQNSSFK